MTQAQLRKKVGALAERLEAIKCELEAIQEEGQCYFDDRSEKWQEGDNGTAYQELVDVITEATDAVVEALDQVVAIAEGE